MEVIKRENIWFVPMETLLFIFYFNITHFGMIKLGNLLQTSSEEYNKLKDYQQLYVVKNLFKCFHLAYLSLVALYIAINTLIYQNWDIDIIRLLGLVYGIPDTYALLTINRLPLPTKIHHSCVTILYTAFLTSYLDLKDITYWKGIVIYAIFSVLSGSVNGFLALRFLIPDGNVYKNKLKKFAFYNYLFCILFIWTFQYYIIYNYLFFVERTIGFYLYLIVCHLILYDDIKLIKFLSDY
jgi:hypothetical protein